MPVEAGALVGTARRGCFVSAQLARVADVQVGVPAQSSLVCAFDIEAMLSDLPTAHPPLPIGRRNLVQGCHGAGKAIAAHAPQRLRIRFVYFPVKGESERQQAYHQHLVVAETLLERVLASRAAGLRPIAPALDHTAEVRATVRPPRDLFHSTRLEYRRWYDEQGVARPEPLPLEVLAAWLTEVSGLPEEEAKHRVAHCSHALPAADQAWLIARRAAAPDRRPLNQAEFHALVRALEGAYAAPAGAPRLERANREIALRLAALLGSVLDEYVASPFTVADLGRSFSVAHLAHLQQTIEASRRMESAMPDVLRVGPKAWFTAKARRMRAEHQIGLAMSPGAIPMMRPPARPAVVVVGGKLRTFKDYWNRSRALRHSADTDPMRWFAGG